ncbi:MAG: WS/DGAT domain-containing protein [Pseudomonadales bacterium]|nr:WS/DGAT domain-containing protein [Pseudomonadales bacterium]
MHDLKNEPVNGVDTAWLRMDSATNLMVISAMIVVDQMEFDDFKAVIQNRFLRHPRFRKKPVHHTAGYFWETDHFFDLDHHVVKVALTAPADKKSLQDYVARQVGVPLDAGKPLWMLHFIENYQGGSAILMRIHHCYADGIALVRLFHDITDSGPNVKHFTPPRSDSKDTGNQSDLSSAARTAEARSEASESNPGRDNGEPVPGEKKHRESPDLYYPWPFYQQLFDSAWHSLERYTRMGIRMSEEGIHVLREPGSVRGYVKDALRVANEITRLASIPSDPKTALKGSLGVKKACAWSEPVNFDAIKHISKRLGCKINDVLLSCVAGALRHYLLSRGDSISNQKIHVTVPVNIRPDISIEDPLEELGNHFGTVFVPLPIGIDNPLERIYTLKHDMEQLKQSLQPGLSYGLLYAAGMAPRSLQRNLMDVFSKKSTAVLSNVPGPKQKRYLGGSCIREQMFWVPQTGEIGLGLSMISYAGGVQFGVVSDVNLCANPEIIVEACVKHMQEYLTLVNSELNFYAQDNTSENLAEADQDLNLYKRNQAG